MTIQTRSWSRPKLRARVPIIVAAVAALGVPVGLAMDRAARTSAEVALSTPRVVALRRLTEAQYRRTIADVFSPDVRLSGRFEPDVRRDGLIAIGSGDASISTAGMEQYHAMAGAVSAQVTGPARRSAFVFCTPARPSQADPVCARSFLAHYGRLLFRRPLTPIELEAQVALAGRIAERSSDFYTGLGEATTALLTSPNFLFRIERSAPQSPARVDDLAVASRLSFLLWNAPPDTELLAAAERGDLALRAGLQNQVERLVASPRLADGIRAFFDDMLQLQRLPGLTKDTARFPYYGPRLAAEAREQTLRTLTDLLIARDGDYRDVFTTRDTVMTPSLAKLYDVPSISGARWTPYRFPSGSARAGVLSQASFLAMFSHPAVSSPTKRGVALNEIFLCRPTPQPPGNVDFSAISAIGQSRRKTMRLRLQQHVEDATCRGCHSQFDPAGVALEQFDAIGRFREREDGEVIDVRSSFGGKSVEGAAGLGRVLHDDPRTAACLVRNLFATGTGSVDAPGDPARIERLTRQFAATGYRLPAFLKALALGNDLYRAPQPALTGAAAQALLQPERAQ